MEAAHINFIPLTRDASIYYTSTEFNNVANTNSQKERNKATYNIFKCIRKVVAIGCSQRSEGLIFQGIDFDFSCLFPILRSNSPTNKYQITAFTYCCRIKQYATEQRARKSSYIRIYTQAKRYLTSRKRLKCITGRCNC